MPAGTKERWNPAEKFRLSASSCEVCGHAYGQVHRLVPGAWGGPYESWNVVFLCPNHHAAIHLLMAAYGITGKRSWTPGEDARLEAYEGDRRLKMLFMQYVEPVLRERWRQLGKWHPYRRVLPEALKRSRRERRVVIPNELLDAYRTVLNSRDGLPQFAGY